MWCIESCLYRRNVLVQYFEGNSNGLRRFFHANFSSRRRVIQIFARGARILDGAFMTQDLSLKSSNTETSVASDGATVSSVSIADPYVLLKMNDGSIQLLVGGMSGKVAVLKLISVSEKWIIHASVFFVSSLLSILLSI